MALTVAGVFGVSAFAAPSYSAYTSITNNNHTVTGVTQCSSATFCSVNLVAYYAGGQKTGFSSGATAASVVRTVGTPYSFTSANSQHEIDYFEKGTLNTIRVTSGAGESR